MLIQTVTMSGPRRGTLILETQMLAATISDIAATASATPAAGADGITELEMSCTHESHYYFRKSSLLCYTFSMFG